MSKGELNVVIYVKEKEKEFSITARKPSSELALVTEYMEELGYTSETIAKCLDKQEAEELKDRKRKEYEDKGYIYKKRNVRKFLQRKEKRLRV